MRPQMTRFINTLQRTKKVDERVSLSCTSTSWRRWDYDKFNVFVFAERRETTMLPVTHSSKRELSQTLLKTE